MTYEPSEYQVDQGARRLVTWETGLETWPDSWHPYVVASAQVAAKRVWKAMWTAANRPWPNPLQLELFDK